MSYNRSEKRKDVTISDIARHAGVSIATVSRVINNTGISKEETARRVWQAARELGYEAGGQADSEALRQNPVLPVLPKRLVLINIPSMSNPFFDEVVKGARSSVLRHNGTLLINESDITYATIDSLLSVIKENRAAGLITCNHMTTDICRRLADHTTVIQCTEFNEKSDIPYVCVDDFAAAKTAVDHLISSGRRRIALINGSTAATCIKKRQEGYLAALQEAGLPVSPEYIYSLNNDDPDLAFSSTVQLLRLPEPPDAIFSAADAFCPAIIRACHLSGVRIPADLSLVGFDNLDVSRFLLPSLTTIRQPRTQLGFMAAEMLFKQIEDPQNPPGNVLLDTELIIRESSVR